jgi:hypothetical protein
MEIGGDELAAGKIAIDKPAAPQITTVEDAVFEVDVVEYLIFGADTNEQVIRETRISLVAIEPLTFATNSLIY